jgi:hypothetical protein
VVGRDLHDFHDYERVATFRLFEVDEVCGSLLDGMYESTWVVHHVAGEVGEFLVGVVGVILRGAGERLYAREGFGDGVVISAEWRHFGEVKGVGAVVCFKQGYLRCEVRVGCGWFGASDGSIAVVWAGPEGSVQAVVDWLIVELQ